jgi:superoxide reductase
MTTAGTTGALFLPQQVLAASSTDILKTPLAGGVYYTKEHPGRWATKVGGHLPSIERAGNKIEVVTKHPMKGFKHYIVKHVILDEKFRYVEQKVFDPTKDRPESGHDISKLRNVVYAVSMCNLHDTWINVIKL